MLAGQVADEFARLVDLLGIEAGRGLVEDEHVGIVHDGLRESNALPVSLGKLAQQLVFDIGHVAASHHIIDAPVEFLARQAFEPAHKAQILVGFHVGIEGRRFRQIADAAAHLKRLLQHIKTCDACRTRGGRQKAREHAHGCGFSGAVGAKETDDLTFVHGEGNLIDCDGFAYRRVRSLTVIISVRWFKHPSGLTAGSGSRHHETACRCNTGRPPNVTRSQQIKSQTGRVCCNGFLDFPRRAVQSMKITRRSLAKGLAATGTAAGLSGLLRAEVQTGPTGARPTTHSWTEVYPGVWRATVGTPERYTPVSSRLMPPQTEAFAKLPHINHSAITSHTPHAQHPR